MDFRRRVHDLTAARGRRVPPLTAIEARARRLRVRGRVVGGATVLAVLLTASVVVAGLDRKRPDAGAGRSDGRPAGSAPEPSPTSRSDVCRLADGCVSGEEKLAGDERWLGDRLSDAGLEYINEYRPDGGGGHINPEWGFQIWVLRPQSPTPEDEAARWGYDRLWSTGGGVTVFGHARPGSPTAYFYWRAGGVDAFVQLDWQGSRAQTVDDLRDVFGRIAAAQEDKPYPYRVP